LATPSIRFLFIGSRFMLHASFPRSVTLTQLRFTLLTVTSSQRVAFCSRRPFQTAQWNCSSSVEPDSALTEDEPP
jgi:hypothetical protein